MKSYRILMVVAMALLVVFSNCKKDKDRPAVENEDVSDLIVNSLETDAYGIASQIEVATRMAESHLTSAWCGYIGDTSIYAHYQGVAVQYTFTFDWTYNIHCSGTTPNIVNIANNNSGSCTTSILSSTFNSKVNWTLIGVTSAFTDYVLNGTYVRTGDFNSTLRDKHSFASVLTITFQDVTVGKTSYIATGGTASITAVCTAAGNEEFEFSGDLVFNGNQNCTLTLEGKTYTVQL